VAVTQTPYIRSAFQARHPQNGGWSFAHCLLASRQEENWSSHLRAASRLTGAVDPCRCTSACDGGRYLN